METQKDLWLSVVPNCAWSAVAHYICRLCSSVLSMWSEWSQSRQTQYQNFLLCCLAQTAHTCFFTYSWESLKSWMCWRGSWDRVKCPPPHHHLGQLHDRNFDSEEIFANFSQESLIVRLVTADWHQETSPDMDAVLKQNTQYWCRQTYWGPRGPNFGCIQDKSIIIAYPQTLT